MVAVVVCVHNRPEYLKDCLKSIKEAISNVNLNNKFPPAVLLMDDGSIDRQTLDLISEYRDNGWKCSVNTPSIGVRATLVSAITMLKGVGYDTFINIDSDVVISPDFFDKILALKQQHPNNIVSGINVTMRNKDGKDRNPLIEQCEGYALKSSVGGCCLCYNLEQYEKYVKPALLTTGNWDNNTCIASMKDGHPIVVATPSICQHIGIKSSMGHTHELPDRADDFKILKLGRVTLIGVDNIDTARLHKAAEISQRDIEFGSVNMITDVKFTGKAGYSDFMINHLHEYIADDSTHCLVIQHDGYVLNALSWEDEWLQYDYIGASWLYKDNMNVGNGGFSLRSKRLCQILAAANLEHTHPEDYHICRTYRESLECDHGIKFAPEEVANKFSIEAYGSSVIPGGNKYNYQFGFHSSHVDFTGVALPHIPDFKPVYGTTTRRQPQRTR